MKTSFKLGAVTIAGVKLENIEVTTEFNIGEARAMVSIAKEVYEYLPEAVTVAQETMFAITDAETNVELYAQDVKNQVAKQGRMTGEMKHEMENKMKSLMSKLEKVAEKREGSSDIITGIIASLNARGLESKKR